MPDRAPAAAGAANRRPAPRPDAPGVTASLGELLRLRHAARTLRLDLSRGVRAARSGPRRSSFRGRGMDYAEFRRYVPGDEVRHIDWRVTARTGKTHTKLFSAERERPVLLLLDFSSAMYFGTRQTLKTVLAARAAALVTWSAAQNGDRTGGIVINDAAVRELKPRAGRHGALAMLNALASATADLPTAWRPPRLNTGLGQLAAVTHPGSLVFLFSDFYGLDAATRKLLAALLQHNDVVACQVCDPLELAPPAAGRLSLIHI